MLLPKDSVAGPHESRHAVLVPHVDVLSLGNEVCHNGRVTKLSGKVDPTAACSQSQAREHSLALYSDTGTLYTNTLLLLLLLLV